MMRLSVFIYGGQKRAGDGVQALDTPSLKGFKMRHSELFSKRSNCIPAPDYTIYFHPFTLWKTSSV